MGGFTITTTTETVELDSKRSARASFSVTNTSHQNLQARARVVASENAQASWFSVVDADRPSPAETTQQFEVRIVVPPDAAPGTYRFRLDVTGVEDPDEFSGQSSWVPLEVPAGRPAPSLPWPWILAAAGALVVVLGGAVLAWVLTHRAGPEPAELKVSASISDFGSLLSGQTSPPSVATVVNVGGAEARVKAAALAGSAAKDFKILSDSCKGSKLAADASCKVEVAFAPTSSGTKETELLIEAEGVPTPARVALKGTSVPRLKLPTPASIKLSATVSNFGSVQVKQSSPPSVVTVTNGGNSVQVKPAALSGTNAKDFKILADGCKDAPLAAKASCQVVVVFTPQSQGSKQASLVVEAGQDSEDLDLTGSGLGVAQIAAEPSSVKLNLHWGSKSTTTIKIVNKGTGDLRVVTVQLKDEPGYVWVSSSKCENATVAPGASCEVKVSVQAPVLSLGDLDARLDVYHDLAGAKSPLGVPITIHFSP